MTTPATFPRRSLGAALALAAIGFAAACGSAEPAAGPAAGTAVAGSSQVGAPDTAPSADDLGMPSAAAEIVRDFGYAAGDIRTLVDELDATPVADRAAGLMASVRPTELQLSDDEGRSASIPLPEDAMYVSIAPYVDGTHECHFHSLTTCRGELANTGVTVTVRDADTGAVIFDGPRTTFDNGFVGLWLPRGITAEVAIDYQGKSAVTTLDTAGPDAATCVTTMQLV